MPMTFGAPTRGWPDFRHGVPFVGRTYVAGPMRGYDRFNFPAFDAASKELRALGWEVHSPAEMDREKYGAEIEFLDPGEITPAFMHAAMRRDIKTLLEVDAIHLLPGWTHSTGARLEHSVSDAIGLQIWTLDDSGLWVRVA